MKRILKTAIVAGVFAAAAAVALPAAFCGGGKECHGGGKFEQWQEKRMDKIMDKLNLTPEQSQKIKDIRAKEKAAREEFMKKMKSTHEELQAEIEKPVSDKARINALLGELEPMMASQFRQRIENILAVKDVLTPEQFASMREEMRKDREAIKAKIKEGKAAHHHGNQHPDQQPAEQPAAGK